MFDDIFIARERQKLLAERDQLANERRRLHVIQSHDPQDVDDSAEQSEELTIQSAEADAVEDRLEDIKKVLEKMEHGQYGRCEICHSYIDRGRLEVDPAAVKCMRCSEWSDGQSLFLLV